MAAVAWWAVTGAGLGSAFVWWARSREWRRTRRPLAIGLVVAGVILVAPQPGVTPIRDPHAGVASP